MTIESNLTFRVTLVSGVTFDFEQSDPEIARRDLSRLDPARLFREPVMVVSSKFRSSTFRTRDLLRIDVDAPVPESWLPDGPVDQVRELDPDEWASRLEQLSGTEPEAPVLRSGAAVEILLELTDLYGRGYFFEVTTRAPAQVVQEKLMRRVFERGVLVASTEHSCAVVNFNCISAVHAIPGPPPMDHRDLEASLAEL